MIKNIFSQTRCTQFRFILNSVSTTLLGLNMYMPLTVAASGVSSYFIAAAVIFVINCISIVTLVKLTYKEKKANKFETNEFDMTVIENDNPEVNIEVNHPSLESDVVYSALVNDIDSIQYVNRNSIYKSKEYVSLDNNATTSTQANKKNSIYKSKEYVSLDNNAMTSTQANKKNIIYKNKEYVSLENNEVSYLDIIKGKFYTIFRIITYIELYYLDPLISIFLINKMSNAIGTVIFESSSMSNTAIMPLLLLTPGTIFSIALIVLLLLRFRVIEKIIPIAAFSIFFYLLISLAVLAATISMPFIFDYSVPISIYSLGIAGTFLMLGLHSHLNVPQAVNELKDLSQLSIILTICFSHLLTLSIYTCFGFLGVLLLGTDINEDFLSTLARSSQDCTSYLMNYSSVVRYILYSWRIGYIALWMLGSYLSSLDLFDKIQSFNNRISIVFITWFTAVSIGLSLLPIAKFDLGVNVFLSAALICPITSYVIPFLVAFKSKIGNVKTNIGFLILTILAVALWGFLAFTSFYSEIRMLTSSQLDDSLIFIDPPFLNETNDY